MITGELTDEVACLLEKARGGDGEALTALYEHFLPAVRRAAGGYVRDRHEADDLAQEAFYLVFRAIKAGRGPDSSFIGYVLSTLRRLAFRHSDVRGRVVVTEDIAAWEPASTHEPTAKRLDDVTAAWSSLPERWRQVLWLIDVEQYSPTELAGTLDMSPTAVSSLATRARDALRTAFLAQQVIDDAGRCGDLAPRLAALARGTLADRRRATLTRHVESCSTCQKRLAALTDNAERAGLATRTESGQGSLTPGLSA